LLEKNKIHCMNCLAGMKELADNSVDSVITDPPYGISFMGKSWDYDVPKVEVWKEVLRVLKPGGHLLSFAGTRTYHRMACNIEDAGFEIRDMISWLYGSGFPKSLNIGKAVDKLQGNEREVIGKNSNHRGKTQYENKYTKGLGQNENLTKGNSVWEGWGTALKPACEPVVVARKPLSEKGVALNVLKWGTGGINIDESRIEGICGGSNKRVNSPKSKQVYGIYKKVETEQHSNGRFPSNVILDEEAGVMLDKQSGITESHKGIGKRDGKSSKIFGWGGGDNPYGDKGGASRFFYCAKSSKGERNKCLEGMEEQQTTDGCIRSNPESAGKYQANSALRKNFHPTVKPVRLMEYLVRLVTPQNGLVLDPFMGSGTTAVACKQLNINFIGFELSEEYVRIANKRLSQANLNDWFKGGERKCLIR